MKFSVFTALVLLTILSCYPDTVNAQGCSDAGFCTLRPLKTDDTGIHGLRHQNRLSFGLSNGKGDSNIGVLSGSVEYSREIDEAWNVNIKLVFNSLRGELTTSTGLSDLYLTTRYAASELFKLTFGLKIPLEKNKALDGLALPMAYQTSLGTVDVIAGVSTRIQNVDVTLAIQQPMTQNENQFLPSNYPTGSQAYAFLPTRNYERKGDILLRVTYPIKILQDKLQILPSLLPIYHISNDRATDTNGSSVEISGSRGLTLNGNVFVKYAMDDMHAFELSYGMPFVTRTARPDGLTRKYVVALQYEYQF